MEPVKEPPRGLKEKFKRFLDLDQTSDDESEAEESGFMHRMDEFFEEGELSGVKFFHSSFPTWFRLMWIVCMFAFLGMMTYQLTDLILQFQGNPLSMDIKYENPWVLKLPSILACPHNQLRLTKMVDAGAMDYAGLVRLAHAAQMAEQEFTERMNFVTESWPGHKRRLTTLWETMKEFANTTDCSLANFTEKLGAFRGEVERLRLAYEEPFPAYTLVHALGKLVTAVEQFHATLEQGMEAGENCTLLGDMARLSGPVTEVGEAGMALSLGGSFQALLNVSASRPEEFIVSCRYMDESPERCNRNWSVVETIFGRCFLLNLTTKNVTRAGIDFALKIQFDTAASDAATEVDKGMTISLIPEGRPAIVTEPIEINPGYNLHLPLRFAKEEFYESECSEAQLQILPEYSQAACMLQKFLKLSQSECGCTPLSEVNLGPADCSVAQQLGCVARLRHNVSNVWDSNACKVSCSERRYEASVSYSTDDAEKGSRDVALYDVQPWADLDTGDPLQRTRYTHIAALKGLANATVHLDPRADLYGEEWLNRTRLIMVRNTVLKSTPHVRQVLQKAAKAKSEDLKNRMFYKAFNPMLGFTMGKLMFGLFYHGSEYGAWPMQRANLKTIETMQNMTQCRVADLLFPVPPTFQRNFTAYLVANSLTPFKTALEGAKATGKATLLGTAFDWVDVLVGSLNTSVEEGRGRGRPDGIAEQLLPLALPYHRCVKAPASNCSVPDGEDVACTRSCQAELDPLAYALEAAVQLRDIAFLTKRYQTELDDLLRLMGTFMEGISRTYMIEFLEAYNGWRGYVQKSELEHATYFIENFHSWEVYRVSVRDKVKSIQAYLDFMTSTTKPENIQLVFHLAKLDLGEEYDRFFDTYSCLRHYERIWDEVAADGYLSDGEYRQDVQGIMATAKDTTELSRAGPTYFRKNVMSATIYLAEMKQKVQKQRLAYDFWSMLSDVGGTISFYIGGTIITFFEILFMCTTCQKKRKAKTRIQEKGEQVMASMGAVTAFKMAGNKTLGGGEKLGGAASGATDNMAKKLGKTSLVGIKGSPPVNEAPAVPAAEPEKPPVGQLDKAREPKAAGAALLAKLRKDRAAADEAKEARGGQEKEAMDENENQPDTPRSMDSANNADIDPYWVDAVYPSVDPYCVLD